MGRLHARVLAELPSRFDLVGVFDTSYAAAREVAQRWRIPVFARESDAIAAAELVVVATPIAAHAVAVLSALRAGKSVLVEKPLCARLEDAFALLRAAGGLGRLFVGHSERFNPVVRALRRAAPPHDIVSIDTHRFATAMARDGERAVLLSLGVHDLDLAAYLTASPVDVRSASGTEDGWARVELSAGSGAVARVRVDGTSRARERRIQVTTTRHVFSGDLLAPRLVCTCRTTGTTHGLPLPGDEPLVAQARAIATVLDGGAAPELATGVDGARALAVAESARAWLRPSRGVARVSEAC
jgi:predicted dehydrogenase